MNRTSGFNALFVHFYEHWRQDKRPAQAKKKVSQADVAREAAVSREIIGQYERNEASPSVEVAKKIADALEVSLDYPAGDSDKAVLDKRTLKLIHDIEEQEPAVKDKLLFLAKCGHQGCENR